MFQPSAYSGPNQNLAKIAQDIATSVQQGKGTPTFSFNAPGVNVQLGEQPEPWNPLWYIAGGVGVVGLIGVGLWATGKIKF